VVAVLLPIIAPGIAINGVRCTANAPWQIPSLTAEHTLEPNTKEGERTGGERDYNGHQHVPTLRTAQLSVVKLYRELQEF
jgi:hypothetical protein